MLFRSDAGSDRRLLQGNVEQIHEDLASLASLGVTEVFFDLNFSPRVVAANVDAGAAVAYADQILDAFAPAAPASR